MNEAETRAELIDPVLRAQGWGEVEGTKVYREHPITAGRIKAGNAKRKPLIADYVFAYKNRKLAAMEAKSDEQQVGEGVGQAKNYADKLNLRYTYAANGKEWYLIDMETGQEGPVATFPTPDELWQMVFPEECKWEDKFDQVPFEDVGGTKPLRFYQEIAVNNVLRAVANDKNRILLTLATGTGKTFIAFQIAWKLFHSRWNLKKDGSRQPRILFLADRNILADQAFNNFNAFPEDALVRIEPGEISKQGRVPTNGSLFFTIFQTFMSGNDTPHFGQYPADYFDFIIIDECHRGGANDESNWRGILEYFSPAVQLGMTATPKRLDNVNTYKYFGEPVYIYSLKDGINDGFLTPFKVKRVHTTLDEYVYTPDDEVIEGEVEEGRLYTEPDFNKEIEIIARERNRVKIVLDQINQKEKTIIFCANQVHAAVVRDLVNQNKKSNDPNYCQRVTANDGELGEKYLRDFQDNDKTSPLVLTTSQKLSTGVDARNIRNIVLLRPINTMIEFKQIVGRGTRLFEGKTFFTIYDFVNAYHHFLDPEWDGDPIIEECEVCGQLPCVCEPLPPRDPQPGNEEGEDGTRPQQPRPAKIKIKLNDGKERKIQHMVGTSFWSEDGTPISCEQFLEKLYGKLPEFFKDEAELRKIWSVPSTRKAFLNQMEEAGYGKNELEELQKLIDAEKSDLFDVLEYVSFAIEPISRQDRVLHSQKRIYDGMDNQQKEFIDFVLSKYIESGVEELDQDKLPDLLELKYQSLADAEEVLGDVSMIKNVFVNFQQYLYAQ